MKDQYGHWMRRVLLRVEENRGVPGLGAPKEKNELIVQIASSRLVIPTQRVPRFKSAQNHSIRYSKAVKSACPAYTKTYILPTTDNEQGAIVQSRALVSACHGALLNRGAHCTKTYAQLVDQQGALCVPAQ